MHLGSAKLVTWVPWRMLVPSVVRLLGPAMVRVVRLVAPLKALLPMLVMLVGRLMLVMPVALLRALASMDVMPVGMRAAPVQLLWPVTLSSLEVGAMVIDPDVQVGRAKLLIRPV